MTKPLFSLTHLNPAREYRCDLRRIPSSPRSLFQAKKRSISFPEIPTRQVGYHFTLGKHNLNSAPPPAALLADNSPP
jgi:hypothetical protein